MTITVPAFGDILAPSAAGGGLKLDKKALSYFVVFAGVGWIIWRIARANTVAAAEEEAGSQASQVASSAIATAAVGAFV